jgi:hypothetical protein
MLIQYQLLLFYSIWIYNTIYDYGKKLFYLTGQAEISLSFLDFLGGAQIKKCKGKIGKFDIGGHTRDRTWDLYLTSPDFALTFVGTPGIEPGTSILSG